MGEYSSGPVSAYVDRRNGQKEEDGGTTSLRRDNTLRRTFAHLYDTTLPWYCSPIQ